MTSTLRKDLGGRTLYTFTYISVIWAIYAHAQKRDYGKGSDGIKTRREDHT